MNTTTRNLLIAGTALVLGGIASLPANAQEYYCPGPGIRITLPGIAVTLPAPVFVSAPVYVAPPPPPPRVVVFDSRPRYDYGPRRDNHDNRHQPSRGGRGPGRR